VSELLGDVKSSLGDINISLGDTKSFLGDAKSTRPSHSRGASPLSATAYHPAYDLLYQQSEKMARRRSQQQADRRASMTQESVGFAPSSPGRTRLANEGIALSKSADFAQTLPRLRRAQRRDPEVSSRPLSLRVV
jgi:hypothetical protein